MTGRKPPDSLSQDEQLLTQMLLREQVTHLVVGLVVGDQCQCRSIGPLGQPSTPAVCSICPTAVVRCVVVNHYTRPFIEKGDGMGPLSFPRNVLPHVKGSFVLLAHEFPSGLDIAATNSALVLIFISRI